MNKKWEYINQDICKKCFIKLTKPLKKETKMIVMTDYKGVCSRCGRTDFLVDYLEEKE